MYFFFYYSYSNRHIPNISSSRDSAPKSYPAKQKSSPTVKPALKMPDSPGNPGTPIITPVSVNLGERVRLPIAINNVRTLSTSEDNTTTTKTEAKAHGSPVKTAINGILGPDPLIIEHNVTPNELIVITTNHLNSLRVNNSKQVNGNQVSTSPTKKQSSFPGNPVHELHINRDNNVESLPPPAATAQIVTAPSTLTFRVPKGASSKSPPTKFQKMSITTSTSPVVEVPESPATVLLQSCDSGEESRSPEQCNPDQSEEGHETDDPGK